MTAPRQPGQQLRTWKRSRRKHKRVAALERQQLAAFDQSLQREAWAESRRRREQTA